MTTYQMIATETGAPLATVKTCARAVLGNRHRATTAEIKQIKKQIRKEMKHETKRNS